MVQNEMDDGGPRIVALVLDLMFAARVRGAAAEAVVARTAPALLEAVGPGTRLVLVDLQAPDAREALEGLQGRPAGLRVVAWGPHVMEAELEAAREAGADEVLPRGAFVKALPRLVEQLTPND